MRVDSVAKRYAQAVFEIASETGDQDEWARELQTIASVFNDAEVSSVLQSVRVRNQEKMVLAEQLLAGLRPMAVNVGRLLISNGRVDRAAALSAAFQSMLDDQRHLYHAKVTSAVPLGDEERADLIVRLSEMTHGNVDLDTTVDPSILGGVVVRIGDRLIDGSTRAKLQSLRRQLRGVAS